MKNVGNLQQISQADSRWRVLHAVVGHLQQYQTSAGWDTRLYSGIPRDQELQSCELLISDVLAAGVDVHSLDIRMTCLCILVGNRWNRSEDFDGACSERLLIWFRLLRGAGYDLREYLFQESRLYPDSIQPGMDIQAKIENKRKHFVADCYPRCHEHHGEEVSWSKRALEIEQRPEHDNYLVHFNDVFTTIEIERLHSPEQIPGSWSPSLELKITEKSWQKSEMTLFIGPLINGVQDFGMWKKPTMVESWVSPDYDKIERLDENYV